MMKHEKQGWMVMLLALAGAALAGCAASMNAPAFKASTPGVAGFYDRFRGVYQAIVGDAEFLAVIKSAPERPKAKPGDPRASEEQLAADRAADEELARRLRAVPSVQRGVALIAPNRQLAFDLRGDLFIHCEALLGRATDAIDAGSWADADRLIAEGNRCLLQVSVLDLLLMLAAAPGVGV